MAKVFVFTFCAVFLLAFWEANCLGQNSSVSIKVSYLREIPELEKFCLEINTAYFNQESEFLNLQLSFEVFDIERFVMRCTDIKLSSYIDHIMIILPEDGGKNCGAESTCKASILVKSQIVMNQQHCFDVLKGEFSHGSKIYQSFKLSNMQPVGFTCSKSFLMHLLVKEDRQPLIKDIFSPIEDLINNAVSEVTNMGQEFQSQIQEEVGEIGDSVNKEYTALEQIVVSNTADVLEALQNATSAVHLKLDFIAFQLNNEFNTWMGYFHIALRVLEVVGLCVLFGLLCKMYRKVRTVFSFFNWLGFVGRTKDHAKKQTAT